jgi:hypothetical protein
MLDRRKRYVLFLLHVCTFHSVILKCRVKANTNTSNELANKLLAYSLGTSLSEEWFKF